MSLHTDLQDKLYEYMSVALRDTGIDTNNIIFDYEQGVQLNGNFVALDLRAVTSDSRPEVLYIPQVSQPLINDEIVRYRGTVQMGVDVYSSDNAIFIAEQIKANLWRGSTREEANRQNLGFVNTGDTLNLSATQEGRFRYRAQFQLDVNYAVDHKIDETTIGTVNVKGDLDDGKYLINVTVTE